MRNKMAWMVCIAVASGLAFAGHPKVASDLNISNPDAMVDVIVQFKHVPTETHHARVRTLGGFEKRELGLIHGAHYTVPAKAVQQLANDPDVEFVHPDREVLGTAFSGTLDYGWMTVTGIGTMNGTLPYDGSGIGVAIVDSGMDTHEDFKDAGAHMRIVYEHSFVPKDSNTGDAYGHGNHVAGIIGGNGKKSSGNQYIYKARGLAPDVDFLNLRVLDANGRGTDSAVIAALQWAITNKAKYNIRVINLSLGRPIATSYTTDPLCQAAEQAWKAGIVVVAAAGNDGRNNSHATNGYGTIMAPGNDPYVITVGAMKTMGTLTRNDDLIASYSSKGPTLLDHIVKPDVVAPGNQIISVRDPNSSLDKAYVSNRVPVNIYSTSTSTSTPDYYQLSGSSMAAAVVSGAAALLIEQNPSITPDAVKARLMKTASKTFPGSSTATDTKTGARYTSYYDIFTVGAGYLDVAAALANTDILPSGTIALSPAAAYDSSTGTVSLVNGTSVVWGSSIVWGTSVVWGSSIVWGSNVLNGNSIVWGTSSVQGFSIIWG